MACLLLTTRFKKLFSSVGKRAGLHQVERVSFICPRCGAWNVADAAARLHKMSERGLQRCSRALGLVGIIQHLGSSQKYPNQFDSEFGFDVRAV